MSQDEITVMDGCKCIYQLRGVRLFWYDNLILQNIRIISYWKIVIRKMFLILKSILHERVKLR